MRTFLIVGVLVGLLVALTVWFVVRVAGHLAEGRVRLEHTVLRVGDQQAFVNVLEDALRELVPVARELHIADVAGGADQAQRQPVRCAFGHQRVQLEQASKDVKEISAKALESASGRSAMEALQKVLVEKEPNTRSGK